MYEDLITCIGAAKIRNYSDIILYTSQTIYTEIMHFTEETGITLLAHYVSVYQPGMRFDTTRNIYRIFYYVEPWQSADFYSLDPTKYTLFRKDNKFYGKHILK